MPIQFKEQPTARHNKILFTQKEEEKNNNGMDRRASLLSFFLSDQNDTW